ncbi:zinc ribbon domain-containing protein [Candidatus Methylacidiphilum fumarolicum]|uniref:zinc ribbon domain-containing protein n=1 Tax=Candidatus Methylacidiphilum fumarolicum TaxID=591154 RepID=UPI003703C734
MQKREQVRIACFTGDEGVRSSRCAECSHRHKPRGRNWWCPKCGFQDHRDVVGGVNRHLFGLWSGGAISNVHRVSETWPSTRAGRQDE